MIVFSHPDMKVTPLDLDKPLDRAKAITYLLENHANDLLVHKGAPSTFLEMRQLIVALRKELDAL